MMYIGAFALNLYFTATLLVSGLSKLASPDYSLLNTIGFRNKLENLGHILYNILAWTEIGVSVLLVTGSHLATTANAMLFTLFLALQTIAALFTRETNCGCFGNLYTVQNDKIRTLTTATQMLLSYFYFWLATNYIKAFQSQTFIAMILFTTLCILILVQRLPLQHARRRDS